MAKQQMEATMKELAKDPSSVAISDTKTMFTNDSICILHFRFSAKNGFGAIQTSLCEYVYLIDEYNTNNEKTYEAVINLDDKEKKSVLDDAHRYYNEKLFEPPRVSEMKDEDRKAWNIYFAAWMYVTSKGRNVGEDKYDISNW